MSVRIQELTKVHGLTLNDNQEIYPVVYEKVRGEISKAVKIRWNTEILEE